MVEDWRGESSQQREYLGSLTTEKQVKLGWSIVDENKRLAGI